MLISLLLQVSQGYKAKVSPLLLTELPQSESIDMPDLIWRVLTVSAGAYGSHQLTGISRIVKTVISPLADFKISVLVISTYQSDYVLVGFFGQVSFSLKLIIIWCRVFSLFTSTGKLFLLFVSIQSIVFILF